MCMCLCVCVGGGGCISCTCVKFGGGVCSTVLSETLIQLIFVVLKNKIQCTSPIVRRTHGKKLKPKLLIPYIALTKE